MRERKEVLVGFEFEKVSRACRKWFSEDFEEEANGVTVALRKKLMVWMREKE